MKTLLVFQDRFLSTSTRAQEPVLIIIGVLYNKWWDCANKN